MTDRPSLTGRSCQVGSETNSSPASHDILPEYETVKYAQGGMGARVTCPLQDIVGNHEKKKQQKL